MVGVKSQGGRSGEGDSLVSWAKEDIERGECGRRKCFRNGRRVSSGDGGEYRTGTKEACIEEKRRNSKFQMARFLR